MREAFFSASNGTEEQPIFITHSWVNRVWFFFFYHFLYPVNLFVFHTELCSNKSPSLFSLLYIFLHGLCSNMFHCTVHFFLFFIIVLHIMKFFSFFDRKPPDTCVSARGSKVIQLFVFLGRFIKVRFLQKKIKKYGKEFADFPRAQGSRRVLFYPKTAAVHPRTKQDICYSPTQSRLFVCFFGGWFFFHFWRLLACSPQSQFVYTVSVLVKLTPLPLSCLSLIFGYNIAQTLFFPTPSRCNKIKTDKSKNSLPSFILFNYTNPIHCSRKAKFNNTSLKFETGIIIKKKTIFYLTAH